ncbi:hypothetical protein GCM10027446_20600 [Angustibacter peucedani]
MRARVVLPEHRWRAAEAEHHAVVDGWTAGRLARAARGEKHPVEDFLFTYYSQRPAQLRRWHPGAGTVLLGDAARERLAWRWYAEQPVELDDGTTAIGVGVDVDAFIAARGGTVDFVRGLLAATASRPAQLGCFGMHEWAMVYRLPEGAQRHEDWPLRLGPAGTDAVVEHQPVRCSHFDAFRFFTEPARPLNTLRPSRSDQVALEQPGCLHATMDLYKWAYKLVPLVPSDLVARCFELARDVRLLDMQASPYDLAPLDVEPVRVETPEGRAEYAQRQRSFAERAAPLRAELVAVCERWST